MSTPVAPDLAGACEAISDDRDIRVVLIRAEGGVLAGGWEKPTLARGGTLPADPYGCLADLPQPVLCAIEGDALGAGLELALACDVRIAAAGARFGLPDIEGGQLPMAGGTQRLPRLVGRGKALEMILTGEPIDAREALRIGLVGTVVAKGRVMAEAEAIADRIAERGPLAVRYAKEAVSRGVEMPLEQALRFETDLTVILQTTDDRAEGVDAFLNKRKPKFRGR